MNFRKQNKRVNVNKTWGEQQFTEHISGNCYFKIVFTDCARCASKLVITGGESSINQFQKAFR